MKGFFAAGVAAAAAACHAGLVYWDDPEIRSFDVGSYVQGGLVVNYDGIRNAGPDAPHDPAATNWVNCANPGTYDMVRYSLVTSGGALRWTAGAEKGAWTHYGFQFNTNAVFHQGANFTIPTRYSIQALVDAKGSWQTSSGGNIGYVMCPSNANNWAICCMGIRRNGFKYDGTNLDKSFYLVAQNAVGGRPSFGTALDLPYTYGTAIVNVNDGVMFSGTVAPWAATATTDGHRASSLTPSDFVQTNGFSVGGHYPRTDELFCGAIKSYRFYNRCLNDAEVLWNRVVDEARYFGRSRVITAIPSTNVVVAATIPGVKDRHYAIDAGGYAFTAPASRTEGGRRYTLGGYTLDTWNGSAWGDSAQHAGESSCTVSDTNALVRITWQYTVVPGEGLVTYGVGDYVQDGLVWNYDGICNVGADADRDPCATNWVNLGSAGHAYDLYLERINKAGENGNLVAVDGSGMAGGWDPGAWTEKGYLFSGESRFRNPGSVNAGKDYTLQTLVDARADEQKGKDGIEGYVLSASWNNFSILLRGNTGNPKAYSFGWNLQTATNRPYLYHESHDYRYGTAILNSSTMVAAFFEGAEIPTSGTGYFKYGALQPFSGTGYSVGGYGAADHLFAGEIKFLRYYNRPLTAAEVAQNRRVDNYRYFGISPVTNVFVCSEVSYLEGHEKCGIYQVDGAYTFTAPESRTAANGVTYACTGYTIETLNGDGNWSAPVFHDARSYAATGSSKVRLTWKWKGTHGARSAADYGIDDYVSAGLRVHLDGICNVGAGKPHANDVKWWRNLGSNGMDSDAVLNSSAKYADDSAWTDDGYYFCGRKRFVIQNVCVKAGSSYTLQIHSDIDRSLLVDKNESGEGQHNYLFSGSWNKMALTVWRRGNPNFRAGAGVDVSFPLEEDEHVTYLTGLMDRTGASPVARVFPGTTFDTGATSTASALETPTSNNPNLGGWGGNIDAETSQMIIGKIKNFRYYDRPLTEEEIAHNRQVDSARYSGELFETNVLVVAGGGIQAETGAYKVEGEWTFTATTALNKQDRETEVVKYSVEKFVNEEWTGRAVFEGSSYTYSEADNPGIVRLTWIAKPIPTLLLVR